MQPEIRPTGSRFLENLAYLVPGYQGYKDPANRREEDSRLRARLLQRLTSIRETLAQMVGSITVQEGTVGIHDEYEERTRRLDGVADAIRYAPYGFSGFFDAWGVGEDSIERVLEADLLLFGDMDTLERVLDRAGLPARQGARLASFLREIDEAIDGLERHLILRDKILGDA